MFSPLQSVAVCFSKSKYQSRVFSLAVIFFAFMQVTVQADMLCVDDADSLAVKRPLLNRVMNIITDDELGTWTRSNYQAKFDSLPGMLDSTGVTLVKIFNAGNEYVDPDSGGITESNILAGLSHSRAIAKENIPDGVTFLSLPDPIVTLKIRRKRTNYVQGSGWAWNSLMYLSEGVVYEKVFFYHGYYIEEDSEMFLVADNSSRICVLKLPPPVADPAGKIFDFLENVRLSNQVSGSEIFYRRNQAGSFIPYTGNAIPLSETGTLEFFAQKSGWGNSDTVSENYIKADNRSELQLTRLTGEPLGGSSNLTENDPKFVVTLTVPYAGLDSVNVALASKSAQDSDTVLITNPTIQNNALVFTDTVLFSIGQAVPGNKMVEASIYDSITVNWTNPKNSKDVLSSGFPVKPAPKIAKIYFADENGNELTQSLTGAESMVYVVVEDAVFDPGRRDEYTVTLSNRKGDGNISPPDREVFKLQEITSGKYSISLPVRQSPPAIADNSHFEIRIGDELKAVYVNPVTQTEYTDIIGYGIPTQMPGQVVFSNADWSVPAKLMGGSLWDAGKDSVYVLYTDDYVQAISTKQAVVTIENTGALNRSFVDTELINLRYITKQGDLGFWGAAVALSDSPVPVSGDGKLQL
ncbi:MAG: hypothetical protein HQK83_20065, partial [Fibrobacteria bacterium]|nr:hypothetical protein [Fibrobacteria bacterium]